MPFEVPPLPYDYAALEPHDRRADDALHHDKHHQAYVDNANAALDGTDWADRPVEDVLANLDVAPEDKQAAGPQQRRRPREPLPVLGDHEARTAAASRPATSPTRSTTRSARFDDSQAQFERRRRQALRLGLDVARLERHRPRGVSTAEPGLAALAGPRAAPRQRRLGARVLPDVPQPPARLPRRVVERRQLGRGRRAVRARPRCVSRREPTLPCGSKTRNRRRPPAVVQTCHLLRRRSRYPLRLPSTPATMAAVDAAEASDADLIQRSGTGDRAAFETLYRRYARSVFGLALRRLGDRARAEDAVQETFASVWRSARSYKPERGPGAPWLYAVARNAIIDRSRARAEPPMEAPDEAVGRAGPGRAGRAGWVALARAPRARGAAGARARGAVARLLERPVAERGRGVPRHPARHRQDAHARRARAAGRHARRGSCERPDFRELVGDDLPPEEDARLRRVHELLVAPGRPPELPPALAEPPGASAAASSSSSCTGAGSEPRSLLAAALAAVFFGGGYWVGSAKHAFEARDDDHDARARRRRAFASIQMAPPDEAFNWPLQRPCPRPRDLPKGGYYELLLTKDGKHGPELRHVPHVHDGATEIDAQRAVPARRSWNGWVVVAHCPGERTDPPVLTTNRV